MPARLRPLLRRPNMRTFVECDPDLDTGLSLIASSEMPPDARSTGIGNAVPDNQMRRDRSGPENRLRF